MTSSNGGAACPECFQTVSTSGDWPAVVYVTHYHHGNRCPMSRHKVVKEVDAEDEPIRLTTPLVVDGVFTRPPRDWSELLSNCRPIAEVYGLRGSEMP